MPGPVSPQGTTVYFDGVLIGYLTGWDWSIEGANPVEVTHVNSTVVGSGAAARVVREYDCTGVEPSTFAFTFKGPPSYGPDDAGKKATLTFTGGGGYWTGEAILRKFTHVAKVGEFTDGTAQFMATRSTI